MTKRIRRSLSLVAAAALLAGLAGPAFAQTGPDKPAKPGKVKVITITEGENVDGDVPQGTIIPVDARSYSKSPSLIRLRRSFVDKILETAASI